MSTSMCATPYRVFIRRLQDWLRENGGEVNDLPLDLVNRAQDWIWMHKDWEDLIVRYSLSLTSKAATLPANFGRIVRVWHDCDSDGKPEFYYYAYGVYDNGYYITDSFTKSAGHSRVITFYRDPSNTPTAEYIKKLDHFDGGGDEYSFFPEDLLIRTAQKIHIEEADLVGSEYEAIVKSQAEILKNYESSHQYRNRDMRSMVLDDHGDEITIEQYNLEGDSDRFNDGYDNSYDGRAGLG